MQPLEDIDAEIDPSLVLHYQNLRLRARLRVFGEVLFILELLQAMIDQGVSKKRPSSPRDPAVCG